MNLYRNESGRVTAVDEMTTSRGTFAATHAFDQSLLDTVIQQNVNPIEKLEKSSLLVATSVHEAPAVQVGERRDDLAQEAPGVAGPVSSLVASVGGKSCL